MLVQLLGFCFDALQHVLRLLAAEHHDHAFDGVIGLVESEFTQPRRVADGHFAHIPHPHRHAVLRADHHVADIRCVANQSDVRERNKTARLANKNLRRHWNC